MNVVDHSIVLLFILTFITYAQCELITFGIVGSALSGLGYYAYERYKCQYQECCTEEYIRPNLDELDNILHTKLYGQQIAHETVVTALRGHLMNSNPPKALVMSFHGTPGTGKNYVAQIIATSFYKKGFDSKYYHFFNGRSDFPLQREIDRYKEVLYHTIFNSLKECERSMFVFDEVDKMPEGLLNILVPFLDYSTHHKSFKNNELTYQNKAIYIFLTNTGSTHIVNQLINLWKAGKKREETSLQDFEKLVAEGAFLEKGGFHHSDTIQSNVIDHYVPFLPLEEAHVRKCITTAFSARGVVANKQMIEKVLSHLSFGPEPHGLYSMAGCKRIEQKVASIIYSTRKERKNTQD